MAVYRHVHIEFISREEASFFLHVRNLHMHMFMCIGIGIVASKSDFFTHCVTGTIQCIELTDDR